MKRLLILLLCLPLIFACTKEEPFVEGEEIVLNMSVNADGIQSIATRAMGDNAMGDNVIGDPVLWLVVFDGEGMLVEWTKATDFHYEEDADTKVVTTHFNVSLHATLEKRIIHFLLNYVDDKAKLDLTFGHENNVIGAMTVGPNHGVYWQRVELPDGINSTNTVTDYLTKVPLLRNFSKIKVEVGEKCAQDFSLSNFYVLNVPKYGTVAPFANGEFVDYCIYDGEERPPFNGAHFDAKNYETLDVLEGYRGTTPNVDERINKASEFTGSDLLGPDDSYFLYENTYVTGDNSRTVSVLLKGTYKNTEYWYRVDLVKLNTSTNMMEYFDILRNFSYNIIINGIGEGKSSAQEAINSPAGNNVYSSLDIAHLTDISDGTATLEVNHTDTVLVSHGEVSARYRFTDKGAPMVNNDSIKNNKGKGYGWYLTYGGNTYNKNNETLPIKVSIASTDDSEGWRKVTIEVNDSLTERKKVSLTFFAKSSKGSTTVLSRTVEYTLLPQQKMLVECPSKVPEVVGSPVNVSILIPEDLPEAMFPLEFAIEAQGTDQLGNSKDFLVQHISPDKEEVMTVKTSGSIVPNFAGKKSFQYMVTFSRQDYLDAILTTRQLTVGSSTMSVPMRVFTKKFKTNVATSASRVYAYNKYFDLGSDNFINGTMKDFTVSLSGDATATYGIGRQVTLNIQAGEAGKYLIESNTLQSPTRAVLRELTMTENQTQAITLTTSTFAGRGQLLITCEETGVMKELVAAERKYLSIKATSVKYDGSDVSGTQVLGVYRTEADALNGGSSTSTLTVNSLVARANVTMQDIESEDELLYFSYISGNKVRVASAKVRDLIASSANLVFEEKELLIGITDLALSGSQYYGENRDVTLTFNVTKTGTYTITCTEGTGNNATKTYTHTATSIGQQTVSLGKTRTWGEQLNVTVSTTIGGVTYSESIVGIRDVVIFGKALRVWSYWNDNANQITISYNNNFITYVTASELRNENKGFEFSYAGLTEKSELTFTHWDNKANTTRTAKAKVGDLMKDDGLIQFDGRQ